jgi:DNA polymerase III subunit gamma/tau
MLRIDIAGEAAPPTPALLAQQRETERQRSTEQAMLADPVVRAFQEQFGARVRAGSIHPLDS